MACKRQNLRSQTREFIMRAVSYFEEERDNNGPLISLKKVYARAAAAFKIGEATIKRIKREEKCSDPETPGPSFSTPGKKHKKLKVVTDPDDFDVQAIRNHIFAYYKRKEVPTLDKLLVSLTAPETALFKGQRSSLYRLLHKIGFSYKRLNNRLVLMEKPAIALKRCFFLRAVKQIDWEKLIFLDETWINKNICKTHGFTDGSVKANLDNPTGKGSRLIICHAGGMNGWIDTPPLVFTSKTICNSCRIPIIIIGIQSYSITTVPL